MPDNSPRFKALVIDPMLRTVVGHHYHVSRAIYTSVQKAGGQCRVLISRRAVKNLDFDNNTTRCLSYSVYNRKNWSLNKYEREAKRLSRQIYNNIKYDVLSFSAIFLPSCDQVQVAAIAYLIKKGIFHPQIKIVAWLPLSPRFDVAADNEISNPQHIEYKDAFLILWSTLSAPDQASFYCETDAMANIYQRLSRFEISVGQLPVYLQGVTAERGRSASSSFHVVMAGHAHRDKGYEILPDAIRYLLNHYVDLRFTVHGTIARSGNSGAKAIFSQLGKLGDRVEVKEGPLTSKDYGRLISSADLIMLPYNTDAYRTRGSVLFNESVNLGIPVVAPFDCSFVQSAVLDGRAIAMQGQTSDALAASIVEARNSWFSLKHRCIEFARYNESNISIDHRMKLLFDSLVITKEEFTKSPAPKKNKWFIRIWNSFEKYTSNKK